MWDVLDADGQVLGTFPSEDLAQSFIETQCGG